MEDCCENCVFSKQESVQIYDDPREPWKGGELVDIWLCRRYPPKRLNDTTTIYFQHTEKDLWCGEYKNNECWRD